MTLLNKLKQFKFYKKKPEPKPTRKKRKPKAPSQFISEFHYIEQVDELQIYGTRNVLKSFESFLMCEFMKQRDPTDTKVRQFYEFLQFQQKIFEDFENKYYNQNKDKQ